jgi:hypothetical protein
MADQHKQNGSNGRTVQPHSRLGTQEFYQELYDKNIVAGLTPQQAHILAQIFSQPIEVD